MPHPRDLVELRSDQHSVFELLHLYHSGAARHMAASIPLRALPEDVLPQLPVRGVDPSEVGGLRTLGWDGRRGKL